MWLQRFGATDQNIFFGFCAAVFVLLVIEIVIVIVRLRYSGNNPLPGQSLTFFVILSSLLICVSVLFRGVQPQWAWIDQDAQLQTVCQIFVPMLVVGYTMFAAAWCVRGWMILLAIRWQKSTVEWVGQFVVWVIVVIAGVLVIIWELSFPPNVHRTDLQEVQLNSSLFDQSNDNESSSQVLFECRGWLSDGSRDIEQYGWRVATSCYLAVILLLTVITVPLYVCWPMLSMQPNWVKWSITAVLLVTVNAFVCVIVGLIVWYEFIVKTTTVMTYEDDYQYAIIGSLQLWMLFVAIVATLLIEVLTVMRDRKSSSTQNIAGSGKHIQDSPMQQPRHLDYTKTKSTDRDSGYTSRDYRNGNNNRGVNYTEAEIENDSDRGTSTADDQDLTYNSDNPNDYDDNKYDPRERVQGEVSTAM